MYTITRESHDFEERRAPGGNLSHDAGGNIAALQSGQRCISGFRRDGRQQAAGSLRIEEQRAKFIRNAGRKIGAALHEITIVLHAAREKSAAGGFNRAGKVFHARVVEFQGDAAADGHFAGVAQERKSGYIGDGVNRPLLRRMRCFNFMERFGGIAIQARHGRSGAGDPGLFRLALF